MGRSPGISVVIATRDRPELLDAALDGLNRGLRPEDEIVIVDSASTDGRVREVASRSGGRLVRLEQPGTSRARNAGWEAATRDIVAFIDDDCIVTPGWAQSVESAFDQKDVGFVTGRVTGDRPAALGISLLLDEESVRFEGPTDPIVYGHGSNMAFRREALVNVAGFDEGLGPGAPLHAAEDQDIFWRVARAGWRGVYEPAVAVTHSQWRSRTEAIRRQFAYGVGAGAVAVKMIRMRDPLGWRVLQRRLWTDALGLSIRSALRGHKSATIGMFLKFFGVLVGCLRSASKPIRDGKFAS